jgi:voltage-gated potassium channel
MKKFKGWCYNLLNGYKTNSDYGKRFDYFISSLIFLNVLAIILASYEGVNGRFGKAFTYFEIFSVIIFSLEYILRLWTAPLLYPKLQAWKARLRFIFSVYGLIDLFAILPFYLPMIFHLDLRFMRALRLLRLARLFKLNRHSSNVRMLGDILKEKRNDLLIVLTSVLIILVIAASLMYNLEKSAQPDKFPNIGAAFWWALATLTTIGYGDIVPVTNWGKFLSGVIAFLGIAIVALPTGILSAAFTEKLQKKEQDKANKHDHSEGYKYCPHCGKKLE